MKKYGVLLLVFMFFMAFTTGAQERKIVDTLSAKELERYKEQTRQLISFLEYSLNMLGSPETSNKEKDIIINESYKKIFRDSLVQIEDDLDENRDMPISKDVQAYMKDIVFFFKEAGFSLEIKDVEHLVSENNQLTFKVTLNRRLQAKTIKGEKVDNNQERYVEINLDKDDKDLKIVSIYTHNINRRDELRRWWTSLPFRWRKELGKKYTLNDSLDMSNVTNFTDSVVRYYLDTLEVEPSLVFRQLNKITRLTEIDISGESGINTLKGLTKLAELRKLDISNTSVESLLPVRNLNNLQYLKAENTPLRTLDPLRYATQIRDLILNKSLIRDISAVKNFPKLRRLHLNQTQVKDLSPLKEAFNLQDLRIAKTAVSDLSPLASDSALVYLDVSNTEITSIEALKGLKKIERLDARHTSIDDLSPLKNARDLKLLLVDDTQVSSLKPLLGLKALSKIYCDNTGIGKEDAAAYMKAHPESVVVYNTRALMQWWNKLDFAWKKVFRKKLAFEQEPSKADLHRISQIVRLDVAGNTSLREMKPVSRLSNLQKLDVSNTPVKDLSPLKELFDLIHLNCSGTRVTELDPISGLNNLEVLHCANTSVKNLEPLSGLQHLEVLNVKNTLVKDLEALGKLNSLLKVNAEKALTGTAQVQALLKQQPELLVIYRTGALTSWWKGIPEPWKTVMNRYVKMDEPPTPEQLHKITTLTRMKIVDDESIQSLDPLQEFIQLRELHVNNTGLKSLEALKGIPTITHLDVADNYRINNLKPVAHLKKLTVLNISNTAVEELEPVKSLKTLEEIYFPGTKVSGLSPLEGLKELRVIDFSNTGVMFLRPLKDLNKLERIKASNTRAMGLFIKKFKKDHPDCEVIYY